MPLFALPNRTTLVVNPLYLNGDIAWRRLTRRHRDREANSSMLHVSWSEHWLTFSNCLAMAGAGLRICPSTTGAWYQCLVVSTVLK